MSFLISELIMDGQKNTGFLDNAKPVFAWKLTSERQRVLQESYRIMVGSEYGAADMWDSKEVCSDASEGVTYAGEELAPCTEYYVKVIVKNNYEEYAECGSKFETTLLCEDISAWEGAEFIGAPEYYVCSETLGLFRLESEMRLEKGGRAGLIFGADDYRLQNRELNELLLEGENYIMLCLEKREEATRLEVFRVGYGEREKELPFDSLMLPKEAEGTSYRLRLDVTGNCVNITVNTVFIKRLRLNPLGENDVTTFPYLCNVGYFADAGTRVHFDGIRCSFLREPSHCFYECDTEQGVDIFAQQPQIIKRTPDAHALPMLRRNFTAVKKLKKARLYATARGIYECRINGKAVSEEYFAPGASHFDKHLYYQTYDVTELVAEGENGIGFTLAPGWWSGAQTFVLGCFNLWGDKESVMAKLVLTYQDGSTDTIVTNAADWDYYGEGAYKYAGFFQGERVDGRELAEYERFSKPDYMSEKLKKPVVIVPDIIPEYDAMPGGLRKYPELNRTTPQFIGRTHCPVRAVEEIAAVSVASPAKGVYIYDLGQEIAGVPRIVFSGRAGETAVIRHAEMLYPALEEYKELAGRLLVANLREAASTDKYILSGKKGEVYSPRFTFHGFRYIEISGVENPPAPSEVSGIQLSSIQKITGSVETDDGLLNRFIKNVKYSQLSNFISIPTDCPQRNERLGWAGDTHVFCKTANLNADTKAFYLRYLEALRDGQEENGNMPEIAPVGGGFGGITYGSALAFLVNDLYDFYGDRQMIRDNYPTMKKYMDYLAGMELPGSAYAGPIDDWLAPEKTDSHLIWNAFYGRDCRLMARFAELVGESEDKERFLKKAEEARRYFDTTFFDAKQGVTLNLDGSVNDTMGGYAIALAYGMLREENIPKAQKQLARKAAEAGYRITTGFFGTGLVNPMLSLGGFGEAAYRMMTQTECPSWLYPVTQGATTVWERWDGFTHEKGFGGLNNMNSFNHYSFGCVLSWLYEFALGIRHDAHTPGWKKFIIQPDFVGFKKICGGFETPFGRIESSYEIIDGVVKLCCRIPVNTEAKIILPNRTEWVGSGEYVFEALLS